MIIRLIIYLAGQNGKDEGARVMWLVRNASLLLRNCAGDSELGVFCYNNP